MLAFMITGLGSLQTFLLLDGKHDRHLDFKVRHRHEDRDDAFCKISAESQIFAFLARK